MEVETDWVSSESHVHMLNKHPGRKNLHPSQPHMRLACCKGGSGQLAAEAGDARETLSNWWGLIGEFEEF